MYGVHYCKPSQSSQLSFYVSPIYILLSEFFIYLSPPFWCTNIMEALLPQQNVPIDLVFDDNDVNIEVQTTANIM